MTTHNPQPTIAISDPQKIRLLSRLEIFFTSEVARKMNEELNSNSYKDHKINGATVVETSLHLVEQREEESSSSMVVSLSPPSFSPAIHGHGDDNGNSMTRPTTSAKEGESDDEESSSSHKNKITDISQLPPLPTPGDTKHVQAAGGTCLVVSLVIIVFSVSQSILLSYQSLSDSVIQTFVSLGVIESIWVLVSLVGLLLCDPGTVKRSPQTCFPIPSEVAEVLQNNNNNNPHNNHNTASPTTTSNNKDVQEENDNDENTVHNNKLVQHNIVTLNGDTYCVRCLVWRRQDPSSSSTTKFRRYHHCSICQQCYHDFDHHCSVFGRCIAGTIRVRSRRGPQEPQFWHFPKGNIIYFASLIVSGIAGGVTALVGITLTMVFEYGGWTVVVVLGICYILFVCLFGYRCNLFHKLQRCGRKCWMRVMTKKRKNWNRRQRQQQSGGGPPPPISSSLPRYELASSCDDPTNNNNNNGAVEAEKTALPAQETPEINRTTTQR